MVGFGNFSCLDDCDLFKFWKIIHNTSEIVQDRDIDTMED